MLLGTEQSDVPDIHQQQAGSSTPSLSENYATSTLLSDKENRAELVTNLDPVNPEIARSPVAPKSVDKSQVKVLNSVNCSPLSKQLVYPTSTKKKTEVKKYVAHVLTSAESIALLEEKSKRN